MREVGYGLSLKERRQPPVVKIKQPAIRRLNDMRAGIVIGAVFPDYQLTDHTGKRRKLSDLQGPDPLILVQSRGGYCPKDQRQAQV